MSGMFWASVAGARANNLQAWMDYAGELEGRVNSLERDLGQLQDVLKEWQEETARANASAGVALDAFKEVNGKSMREHFGDEETDRRVAKEMVLSRRHYGLE